MLEMNMNTPFAENARPKTVYVQLTRNTNGTYTVEKARVLEKTNQYTRSIRRVNKRAIASELKQAAYNGELYVS